MPQNPSARFKVVQAPTAKPGRCFTCHGTNNPPFIDPGMSHVFSGSAPNPERDGRVYICSACVIDMYNQLNHTSDDVERRIDDARRAGFNSGINSLAEALNGYITNFTATGDPAPIDDPGSEPIISGKADNEDRQPAPANNPEANEDSRSDADTSGSEGSDGVSGDRSDEFGSLFRIG